MKKWISIVLAIVLTAGVITAFAACSGNDTPTTDASDTTAADVADATTADASDTTAADNSTEDNTSSDNTLKVGLECAYAPFNWTQLDDSNGAVPIKGTSQYANGYDIQIAKKIAEGLNKELVVVKLDWDGLIPAVTSGAIDMIIAGMSPTADRKESIDFSDAYYTSSLVVVVKKDGKFASAASIADLSGAKIVGQQGTVHAEVVSQIPDVDEQTPMADFTTMIVALNSGAIDGYVAEEPGAIANCEANDNFTYLKLVNNDTGFTVSDEDVQIAVGLKKDSELTAQINEVLAGISEADRVQLMLDASAQQPKE